MCYYIKRTNCINRKNKELITNDIYIQDEINENIEEQDESYLDIFKQIVSLFLYFFGMFVLSDYVFIYVKNL
tara:strand:- start:139 stop:354 length:216 start_codon:yes stop_codon:yes gene_type:complete